MPRVVARIYDPRRAAIYQRLGIPTVATVAWTTERVLRRLVPEDQGVEWVDPSAKVCLVERIVPPTWAGHRVIELNDEGVMQVAAIQRLGVTQLPKGDMVLQEGDVVYLTASGDALDRIDNRLAGPVKVGGH